MAEENKTEIEQKIASLENQLNEIQRRNKRVEADKAWEVSKFRIGCIVILTYLTTCLVFYILGVTEFYLSAIIPTLGYYLSTQGLPILKNLWVNRYLKK